MGKVLIDTCIWSEVFRRKNADPNIQKVMKGLMEDLRIIMIGPVRQEILSGIKEEPKFDRLEQLLRVFPDEPILSEDYILAAHFSNECRKHGIHGSPIDFLICAVAYRLDVPVFTTDNDFTFYTKFLPVTLYR